MRRTAILGVVLLLVPVALAGCTGSVGSCVDHIDLPTPQARFDAASTVVLATIERTDRTVEPDAVYPVFRARVVQVLKGRLDGSAIDLYNPSDQCITYGKPAQYVESDQLATVSRAVLYLSSDDREHVRSLVVPNALDAIERGAALPFSTTSPTPTPTPTPTVR